MAWFAKSTRIKHNNCELLTLYAYHLFFLSVRHNFSIVRQNNGVFFFFLKVNRSTRKQWDRSYFIGSFLESTTKQPLWQSISSDFNLTFEIRQNAVGLPTSQKNDHFKSDLFENCTQHSIQNAQFKREQCVEWDYWSLCLMCATFNLFECSLIRKIHISTSKSVSLSIFLFTCCVCCWFILYFRINICFFPNFFSIKFYLFHPISGSSMVNKIANVENPRGS